MKSIMVAVFLALALGAVNALLQLGLMYHAFGIKLQNAGAFWGIMFLSLVIGFVTPFITAFVLSVVED